MRLQYSETAAQRLEEIWDYHASAASVRVAERITAKIMDEVDWLLDHPRGGQKEVLLDQLNMGHRRWVVGHYKVLYRIIGDLLFITDIFDTRQDPEKMAW